MKTLTIRLSDVLAKRLEQESLARRVSKSEIVRERLDGPGLPANDGGGVMEILKAAWATKVPTHPPSFASRKKQRLADLIRAKKLHRR